MLYVRRIFKYFIIIFFELETLLKKSFLTGVVKDWKNWEKDAGKTTNATSSTARSCWIVITFQSAMVVALATPKTLYSTTLENTGWNKTGKWGRYWGKAESTRV